MKYAIIIDSVAAVPNKFIETRPFIVMPVSIEIDGELVPDDFDEKQLIEFYTGGKLDTSSTIKSSPPSIQQISDLINEKVAPFYDYAFCQTISQKVSPTFDNFQLAANGIAKSTRETRNGLGIEHSFHMNCISTGSTIAGSGLIAIYADIILSKGISYNDYTNTIQKFTRLTQFYGVVTDVMYSRSRALEKGVKAVSFPAALFGKTVGLNPLIQITHDHETKPVLMKRGIDKAIISLLDFANERVKEGLFAPIINLSYSGDPADLNEFKSYQRLRTTCQKHKVSLLLGAMSLSAGVIFGPGALTMGIAPKNQKVIPS